MEMNVLINFHEDRMQHVACSVKKAIVDDGHNVITINSSPCSGVLKNLPRAYNVCRANGPHFIFKGNIREE